MPPPPRSAAELSPQRKARFHHYARIYKEFIRPLLPTCKVYHHEPVNARGGVESSPWFALEYASPDRTKGWALIVRMRNGKGDLFVHKYHNEVTQDTAVSPDDIYREDTYTFLPRGLDPAKRYRVTLDALDTVLSVDGLRLIQDGLPVRLENVGLSELLLFEAEP
jgi:hypothetical protein